MPASILAAPLATALGISTAAATTAVNVAAYIGVSVASYYIQQSMQPKPEVGTKLKAASGGSVPQSMLVGEKECAGSLIYMGTWGKSGKTPNGYLVRVYALADVPCDDFLTRVWCSGEKDNLAGSDDAVDGENVGRKVQGIDDLWAKIKLGDQTVADPYLRAKFGSHPTKPWTNDMIGRGRALLIVTQRLNKKDQQTAWEVTPVLKGARLYDWRKDSTNGGSGAHRWGTSSTYEYSANPIIVAYNIMRGIYRGTDWLYGGLNWPARRLDNDTWTAAANVCDENVSLSGGGTEKRYRMGAEILFSEQPLAVLDRIFAACNARLVESGGIYKVYAGGIGASVYSFTDANIVITEGLTGNLFPQKEDICNTIAGSYIEPDNGGQMKAYRKRFKQAYIDADRGETRASELSFEYVRSNRQAQRLALHALNDNRRFDTKVVAFPPTARKLEPGDIVTWTSVRFGYSSKKFIVGDTTLVRNGVVMVMLREVDSTDVDWSTSDEVAFDVDVLDVDADPSQTLTATVAQAAVTDDDGSNRRPAIRIQASLDDDFVDCEALLWEVRKRLGDQAVIADGRNVAFFDPDSPRFGDITISRNSFLPNKRVQVRFKIDPESDRETTWSAWADTSVYPGGADYLTLTNARLKVADLDAGADNDIDPIDTPNIKLGAVSSTASNSGKAINAFSNSSGHSGTDFVITTGAGGNLKNWAIELDNSAGSMVFLDVDFTFGASFSWFGPGGGDVYANGTLRLYRQDQGDTNQTTLRQWSVDALKKQKNGATAAADSRQIQETIMAGAKKGTARIYLEWKWKCRVQAGTSGNCGASVSKASIQGACNKR